MNEEEINNTPPTEAPEAPEEPTKDEIAEAFTEPEPENPDLVAQAATETPAETAPAFPTEPEKAKKPKKALYALVACICLAVIGGSVWYLTRPKNSDNSTSVQHDIEPAPSLEPVEASKLALKGNQLSDFDLAFLHLENKQGNVIYSPLSIKYALAMLKDGANGRSKEQIEALIGDYQAKSYLNSEHRSLANAIFIRDSFKDLILPSYTEALTSKYNASVVLDTFASATNINQWVSGKTLGIINQLVDDNTVKDLDFMLINALAIDMNWKTRFQCNGNDNDIPCKKYFVKYAHEKYSDFIHIIDEHQTFTFNNIDNTQYGGVGVSANRYDIISELGEEAIRNRVEEEYQKWVAEQKAQFPDSEIEYSATADEYYRKNYSNPSLGTTYNGLDQYIEELARNYQKLEGSTDFLFLDTDTEKVFAKDLQEYDGTTLQYVAIMPKSGSLNAYLNNLTAEKTNTLIANLKDPSDLNSFKDGIITKINGKIPFFKFEYEMKSFKSDLQELGITDVFSQADADLTNMVSERGEYIEAAIHKADIEFTNDGIKAAAASAFGGMGAAGSWDYYFDVPVEEIDLTFDQPFLFLIRDKASGEVWFTGTVYEGTVTQSQQE